MKTEDLVVNLCSHGQTLEDFSEEFPDKVGVVFFETFVIEAIEFIDFSVFVVASEDGNSIPVFDFEKKNVEKGLNAIESTVDVISHEEVVGVLSARRGTGSFPQIQKIQRRSQNCPWVSPQMVTGALTWTILGSLMSISLALV